MTLPSRGVLVTGASRGIGAAIAAAFAVNGDRVAVGYQGSRERAEGVVGALPGDGHVAVQGDVGDPEEARGLVTAATEGLGRIDVLVNNAALFSPLAPNEHGRGGYRIDSGTYEEWVSAWRRTVSVNLLGAANVSWCVAQHMLEVEPAEGLPRGRIVNVGSRGAFRGEPDAPAYGASKAGVHSLGQSLALSLGRHGISVTSVAPGFVGTDMAASVLEGPGGDQVRSQSPFGRVAEPREVASAVLWLASPDAEWASGAVLDLNGASYLR